jgi:hypothetical protein
VVVLAPKRLPFWEKSNEAGSRRQLRCPRKGIARRIAVRRSTLEHFGNTVTCRDTLDVAFLEGKATRTSARTLDTFTENALVRLWAGRRPGFSGSFKRICVGPTSLPRSGENLNWKEGFNQKRSRGMIVVSGAAPQEQRLNQPNGEKTEGSHLD